MNKYYLILLFWLSTQPADSQSIRNQWFKLDFDISKGSLSAGTVTGDTLFSGAVNAVNAEGMIYISGSENYRFDVKLTKDKDGNQVMLISGSDRNKKLNFIQQITLFNHLPAIGFEVIYKNVSDKDLNVRSTEPLRLIVQNGGSLFFGNSSKCLTNGAMYYDAGNIQNLSEAWIRLEPYGETKGGVITDTVLSGNPLTAQSWWNISLFSDTKSKALTAGYLLNANTLGRIQVLKHNEKELSLLAESVLNAGFILKSGREISSDHFVLITGINAYQANSNYATMMREKMDNPVCSQVNGWCNWFYTMDIYDENEILENAAFAARNLKPYGLEYIQIDEGFQITHGDWRGNQRFPHGLKWLCDSIKNLGLKPGIWIAPFVISENSEVFKKHREWLLTDSLGQPMRIGPWPSENTDWYRNETPERYCLDITHPGAEKWYTSLIDTIANRWGFEMIKVDFVAWTVFSASHFYNQGATPAQVYRHALKIMQQTAGAGCHILDCGPGQVSGGYINSMRVEYDQLYGLADKAWVQYFNGLSSSSGAAGKRWFFNNKTWTNDIDHVCLDLLTDSEAKAVVTLIGLSGGNVLSGDRLMNLGESKTEILKKIFPTTPEGSMPVDLDENDPQTAFSCHIQRPFGSWQVVAFFNTGNDKTLHKTIAVEQLQAGEANSYLVFDFWNQHFAGVIADTFKLNVFPASVALFSFHENTGFPQIIGTSRHIKMGAVELLTEKFDTASNILTATSTAPAGSTHSVFVYLPENYTWQPHESKIYEYNTRYTIRQTEPKVLRVDLNFGKTEQTEWVIRFKKE